MRDELEVAKNARLEAQELDDKSQDLWAELDTKNAELTKTCKELNDKVSNLHRENNGLKDEIASLETECDRLESIEHLQELYNRSFLQGKKAGLEEARAQVGPSNQAPLSASGPPLVPPVNTQLPPDESTHLDGQNPSTINQDVPIDQNLLPDNLVIEIVDGDEHEDGEDRQGRNKETGVAEGHSSNI